MAVINLNTGDVSQNINAIVRFNLDRELLETPAIDCMGSAPDLKKYITIYYVTPVPKPRMTRQDKWQRRPRVMRYRDYKDKLREQRGDLGLPLSDCHIIFMLPMPHSWSEKKKKEMLGQPSQTKVRNDIDNLHKALLDAVLDEDSQIYDHRISKFWGRIGAVVIMSREPLKGRGGSRGEK